VFEVGHKNAYNFWLYKLGKSFKSLDYSVFCLGARLVDKKSYIKQLIFYGIEHTQNPDLNQLLSNIQIQLKPNV